ncbi:DMT family transporter [Limosilactobacillus caecicola]|uniref:DMT family transporter n=1 Tax=Limosilactobacillus caecicola TaxID=2941332 RepID=UPI00203DE27B|nr:multidrug efflux SMR transporter [Limosilactobacillus caecicola]
MGFGYLIIAGLCEVGIVYSLNRSRGFHNLTWSLVTLIAATASLMNLSFSMKTLEAGVAYSIWVAFGLIILGQFVFNEHVNHQQMFFMGLIIIAVVGLKIWG